MDQNRLNFRYFPYPYESYHGYLSRLALINGFSSAKHMLLCYQKDGWIKKGDAPLHILQRLTGHEETKLRAIGLLRPKSVNRHVHQLFGQSIPGWWLKLKIQCYICPECVAEQGTTQFLWQFRWAKTCALHKIELIDRCNLCSVPITHDMAARKRCVCGEQFKIVDATDLQQLMFDCAVHSYIKTQTLPHIERVQKEFFKDDGSSYGQQILKLDEHWAIAPKLDPFRWFR